MSKIEDGVPGPQEEFIQDKNWIAKMTEKNVISRIASKWEGNRATTIILKKTQKWVVERGCWNW